MKSNLNEDTYTNLATTANNECKYMITNDQQTRHWQDSWSEEGEGYLSRNLYYVITVVCKKLPFDIQVSSKRIFLFSQATILKVFTNVS